MKLYIAGIPIPRRYWIGQDGTIQIDRKLRHLARGLNLSVKFEWRTK